MKIKGKLNFPIRATYDDVVAILYFNNMKVGKVDVIPGGQEFEVTVANIPEQDEAHFYVSIEEAYVGVDVFVPDNIGWQVQIGQVYHQAHREIHETTTSIPVNKVWADTEDHSRDEVKVVLQENGKDTPYTAILSEKTGWKGEFTHVPYERWSYSLYGIDPSKMEQNYKVPLEYHEYTIRELDPPDGYTPSYELGEPKTESYPVQVVYTPEGSETPLLLSLGNYEPEISPKMDLTDLSPEKLLDELLKNNPDLKEGIEKDPELKAKIEAECRMEYAEMVMMAQGQKFFLNGDQTLISKMDCAFDYEFPVEEGKDPVTVSYDYTMGDFLNFEPADNESGKYLIKYMGSYRKVEGGNNPYLSPTSREDATAFENQAFDDPDTAYDTIPTDSFEPKYAVLQVCGNDQPVAPVLTSMEKSSSYPPKMEYGFAPFEYDTYQHQLYMIGCYDGQVMALSPLDPELTVLLEPVLDAPGEYLAKVLQMNYPEKEPAPGDTIELAASRYICMDQATKEVVYSKGKDDPTQPRAFQHKKLSH